MHLTQCKEEGRRAMLTESIDELMDWLYSTPVDPLLADAIEDYLLAQGEKTWVECLTVRNTEYELLMEVQDRLGWHSFLEGRISTLFLQVMKQPLLESRSRMSPERWGTKLISLLLNITHKQWKFRNSKKHFRRADGLTEAEHQVLFRRVEHLMATSPFDILPCHRHLLRMDFGELAEGSAVTRQYWVEQMESALEAAKEVRAGNYTGSLSYFMTDQRPTRSRRRSRSMSNITPRRSARPLNMTIVMLSLICLVIWPSAAKSPRSPLDSVDEHPQVLGAYGHSAVALPVGGKERQKQCLPCSHISI